MLNQNWKHPDLTCDQTGTSAGIPLAHDDSLAHSTAEGALLSSRHRNDGQISETKQG